jgi:hypothetical protein
MSIKKSFGSPDAVEAVGDLQDLYSIEKAYPVVVSSEATWSCSGRDG